MRVVFDKLLLVNHGFIGCGCKMKFHMKPSSRILFGCHDNQEPTIQEISSPIPLTEKKNNVWKITSQPASQFQTENNFTPCTNIPSYFVTTLFYSLCTWKETRRDRKYDLNLIKDCICFKFYYTRSGFHLPPPSEVSKLSYGVLNYVIIDSEPNFANSPCSSLDTRTP